MNPIATSRPGTVPDPIHPKYRPDIDGLRAVAVGAVVLYHYAPNYLKGGFIGVDVFFVISGYLISTILFENLAAGRFSFADFYARRVRRIFPALLAVLLATLAFSWKLLFPLDYAQAGKHVATGAAFVSNVALWREVGYFDGDASTKPLLHLWSLAIEEQFYIAWPLLLWLAWKSGRRAFPWRAGLVGLGVASFALGVWSVRHDPIAAFYSPLCRAWELLVGAALAHLALHRPRPHGAPAGRHADLRSLLGAALLVAGFAAINKYREFPGAWALLPTFGAALLISAGPHAVVNRRVLARRPVVWFGLISFPLYLWHWPLLVFTLLAGDGVPSQPVRLVLMAVSVVLAWATWRFIERPLRFGRGRARVTVPLAAAMAATGLAGLACFHLGGLPSRFPPAIQAIVHPYMPTFEWRSGSCFLDPQQSYPAFANCPDGHAPGKPTLLLWGDSTAAQLSPGYLAFFGRYNLEQRTASRCPPILDYDVSDRPICRRINDFVFKSIQAAPPDRVVLSGNWLTYDWRRLARTIAELRRLGVAHIDLVGPDPEWMNPLPKQLYLHYESHEPHEIPARMTEGLQPGLPALEADMARFAKEQGVDYVSVMGILCDRQGCLTKLGDVLSAFDTFHFTLEGTQYVVSRFPGAETGPAPPR